MAGPYRIGCDMTSNRIDPTPALLVIVILWLLKQILARPDAPSNPVDVAKMVGTISESLSHAVSDAVRSVYAPQQPEVAGVQEYTSDPFEVPIRPGTHYIDPTDWEFPNEGVDRPDSFVVPAGTDIAMALGIEQP